jgi:outer membrane protein assembly factor BamB
MNRRDFLTALSATAIASQLPGAEPKIAVGPNDWPWWRGPNRDGVVPAQKIPLEWSATKNIVWEAPVPGRGHGSATVVGDRVFLATADEKTEVQGILCLARKTGKQLWQTEVHKGNFVKAGINGKATHASSTPACDGERVFINFPNNNAIVATALDLDGKQIWQQKVTDYTLHQGYAASPAIYGPLVIVMADNKGGAGLLTGLNRETGKVVWSRNRPKLPNYSSPIILNINGKDQLIQIGCNLVTSLDPLTGKENWEIKGATEECVTSTVTDGKHIFTSGGYPRNHVAAVKADGSGVAWDNKTRVYVPSMLLRDGHLYAVTDDGNPMCWKSDTGAEAWKGQSRFAGTFSASPVMVGDTILATNESGRTFIFKANPKEFDLIGENQLGSEVFATATVCGGRIYMRAAVKANGTRQEKLFCIGEK